VKFVKARVGENFVFPDRGGFWKKTDDTTAELVFPSVKAGPARKCSEINPQLNVYVILENKKPKPKVMDSSGEMKITLMDRETEKEILVIPNATPQQVAAYSYSESLYMTPKGKRKAREYNVDEVIMDHDEQSLVLVLRDVSNVSGSGIVDV